MGTLIDIMEGVGDDPWLVLGDFNTVRDPSEVNGTSGDISNVVEEFQDCIRSTGLLDLPMQGETYTWHNCSHGARSLWKKLDRMMANAHWFRRWPNAIQYREHLIIPR
ncbi:UNVERIFIED_CONTAM: hypothetical protein Slati_2966400 [Sesamum latifolium]|uniref:Uncharacterized protein n=1 Tax=Sesamum latifolium TaxID=2727402 RepID=A0AAW2VJK6_9LAMI